MPFSAADAKKHKKGLSKAQASSWAKIANAILADCEEVGGADCDVKAIRIANSKVGKKNAK
ncbi:MAG: hypothetical protein BMS9Abin11_1750 [Gammaproteobacteria bacterium]|nr:MAG: hypothetical protein BMS9Abin11_1750 [Gammaproteobacteria bacterium]